MYICADIGGTSARLQLYDAAGINNRGDPIFKKTYQTESISSFLTLFRTFLDDSDQVNKVDLIVCGIPGDVIANRVGMSFVVYMYTVYRADEYCTLGNSRWK